MHILRISPVDGQVEVIVYTFNDQSMADQFQLAVNNDNAEFVSRKFSASKSDERVNYGESLQRHYKEGPPSDWNQHYISSYASTHPWEDWAETWAHYLHMIDTTDTAFACGMSLRPTHANEPFMVIQEQPLGTASFDKLMSDWFALTYGLNSLNRSIGMPDAYPFSLSPPVRKKLRFIHAVILDGYGCQEAPASAHAHQPATGEDSIAV